MKENELLSLIEHYRKKMIRVARRKNYTSKEVVRISKKLDNLLNDYQNINKISKK